MIVTTGYREGEEMPKANVKFTLVDYLNLPEYPRYELIKGDFLLTPSPTFRHQVIAANIGAALRAWIKGGGLGVVVHAPMDVILSDETVVQPDVIAILNANRHIIHERIEGPPDLVVEILSPITKERDLTVKRKLYARHGVREYWIVDGDCRTIEVNEWTSGGYLSVGLFTWSETLHSPLLPGFELPVQAAFEDS